MLRGAGAGLSHEDENGRGPLAWLGERSDDDADGEEAPMLLPGRERRVSISFGLARSAAVWGSTVFGLASKSREEPEDTEPGEGPGTPDINAGCSGARAMVSGATDELRGSRLDGSSSRTSMLLTSGVGASLKTPLELADGSAGCVSSPPWADAF